MNVKIIRSAQRRRTVSARMVDGDFVVHAPAAMSDAELQPIVEKLQRRWQRRQSRAELSDEDLHRRAQELNVRYFGGILVWKSITWVTNQENRWGSCTPARGAIRISHRLASVPDWVRDYVIVHELAHLLEGNHGPAFWTYVNRYDRAERARGYLMALGGDQQEADM